MPLILRTQRRHEAIEGREPLIEWNEHDYAVADGDRRIGRIYRTQLPAGEKWLWFLQITPAPLPNSGSTDTLDEAKVAIKSAYERIRPDDNRWS